jgi:high-affinity Fe2+/Pb2+ permease
MSQNIELGTNAKTLLDSPTMQKAFEGVRLALVASIEDSMIGDRDTHHELALSLQLLKSIKRQLQRFVNDAEAEKRRNE